MKKNLSSTKDNKKEFRLTKQRISILQQVRKDHGHPTAEIIYRRLKKQYPQISLATVYRNLRFLAEHGYLKEFVIDKVAHFEGRVDSHIHFVCEKCHGVEDLEGAGDKTLFNLVKSIAKKHTFYIRSENFEVRGICRTCQKTLTPKKLVPELFCIACGSLHDDLNKEEPVCASCNFKINCEYIKK